MNDQRKTKKQLLEEFERERARSIALQEVSNRLAGAHDTEEVLDLIVNEAARLVGASAAYIRLLKGDVLVPSATTKSAAAFLAGGSEARGETVLVTIDERSLFGQVVATKKPVISEDGQTDETFTPGGRLNLKQHGFHAVAFVPLLANDRSIGLLTVMDKRIRRFTDDEVSLLIAFAGQASLALEKARLWSAAEREKERSDALYQISNKLAGVHDTDEVLDLIVNEASRLLGTAGAWMRLLEGGVLVPGAATESATELLVELAGLQPTITVGEGLTIQGRVMATKKPLVYVVGDPIADGLLDPEAVTIFQKFGFHRVAAVPLLANDRSVGTLMVIDRDTRRFTDDEVSLLTAFADQAALALDKARLLSEAQREKERSDALYQVSNRLAGAHDTDEVLELVVNEATRLVGAKAGFIRWLVDGVGVPAAVTASAASYLADITESVPAVPVQEGQTAAGHVMATMKPLVI